MPDVSLPPVGELVLITDQQGQVSLGYRHHQEAQNWLERLGKPPIRLADVQSWCPVLVVPDTDEVWARVSQDVRRAEATRGMRETDVSWVAEAVLAAVRGAAIR